jgi:hypothetical protein
MNEGESAVGDGVCLAGHFESNGSGGKLWCAEGGVQAICSEGDFLLVGVEKIGYTLFHLKSLLVGWCDNSIFGNWGRKTRRISGLWHFLPTKTRRIKG